MKHPRDKAAIYVIEHRASGRFYIGSSRRVYTRWYEHRKRLNVGKHHSPHLQHAWSKYGEAAFEFYILEECETDALLVREQAYLDAFCPVFNVCTTAGRVSSPDVNARRAATLRAKAALVTHCPNGHAYDAENTYRNAKGKRICKRCNADRVYRLYANDTSEQRAARCQRMKQNHQANREKRLAAQRAYAAAHRAEKHAYDRAHREEKRMYDRARRELRG